MNPLIIAGAETILILTFLALLLSTLKFWNEKGLLVQALREAQQQIAVDAGKRRQAEIEFTNLNAVVKAFQEKPILANLTDNQVQFIISSVSQIIASQSKEPSRLN